MFQSEGASDAVRVRNSDDEGQASIRSVGGCFGRGMQDVHHQVIDGTLHLDDGAAIPKWIGTFIRELILAKRLTVEDADGGGQGSARGRDSARVEGGGTTSQKERKQAVRTRVDDDAVTIFDGEQFGKGCNYRCRPDAA